MALLSIIRSIASSKPDEINERINVRLVRPLERVRALNRRDKKRETTYSR